MAMKWPNGTVQGFNPGYWPFRERPGRATDVQPLGQIADPYSSGSCVGAGYGGIDYPEAAKRGSGKPRYPNGAIASNLAEHAEGLDGSPRRSMDEKWREAFTPIRCSFSDAAVRTWSRGCLRVRVISNRHKITKNLQMRLKLVPRGVHPALFVTQEAAILRKTA
jgi:hypothetical protein